MIPFSYDKKADVRRTCAIDIENAHRHARENFGGWTEMQQAIIDMERSGKRGAPIPTHRNGKRI